MWDLLFGADTFLEDREKEDFQKLVSLAIGMVEKKCVEKQELKQQIARLKKRMEEKDKLNSTLRDKINTIVAENGNDDTLLNILARKYPNEYEEACKQLRKDQEQTVSP